MSKLAAFDQLLLEYQSLACHQNPVLKQRLHDVQAWMKARIATTHHDFFTQPDHVLMAQYFFKSFIRRPRL